MPEHHDNDTQKHIILAAGGTGGHLFPALALAEELAARNCRITIATDERGLRFKSADASYDIQVISSATVKPGIMGKLQTFMALGMGLVQSLKLHITTRPDVVVGFGGYPAFPPVYAAQVLGIKTVLHESNAVLGRANQMLARLASKIAISLPVTKGVTDTDTIKTKAVVTGNPVRAAIAAHKAARYTPPTDQGPIRIFVMGGSQGARIFSDVIPAAIHLLPDQMRKRLEIIQQCRPEDIERTQAAYDKIGVTADLQSFFDDAPAQLEKCHLFIGRSGASTVSDVACVGRPAIFVPMQHADMQQKINADVIADAGGAWVMMQDGFTAEALSARLEGMFALPDGLAQTAEKCAAVGRADAAQALGNVITALT